EKLGDGWDRVRGDLDEIKPSLSGSFQSDLRIDRPMIVAGLIDQLHFAGSELLINARAVFLDGLRSSHRTTNGSILLCCCDKACGDSETRRIPQNRDKSPASQRQYVPEVRLDTNPLPPGAAAALAFSGGMRRNTAIE